MTIDPSSTYTNAYALWRWTGSVLPGGYSTAINTPSWLGMVVRSFDMSCVTFACWASNVTGVRHARSKIAFADFIHQPLLLLRCAVGYSVKRHAKLVLPTGSAMFRNGFRRAARFCPEAGSSH